jgi:hypothetical protein
MKSVISGVVLATSTFAMSNVASVSAAYPASRSAFPACGSDAAAEYCIEQFAFTPTGGVLREVTPSDIPEANLDSAGIGEVNVVATLSAGYAGTSSTPMLDGVLASLSLNFYDPLSTKPSTLTKTGLRDGLYKVVIRTGDFDPSSMMLIGAYDSYTVVKGADGFFTVTLTARPIPWAAVVNLGDDSALQACKASQWTTNCEANMANQKYILATFNMMDTAVVREAARGSWVSTSASTIQVAASTSSLQYKFTVEGPHYVPADFGVPELAQENGRSLNPAFFKMYVPFAMMAASMSQAGGAVSAADVATMMANPSSVLTGTIFEKNGTAAAVEVPQELTFASASAGVVVDFNLKHFSAPNPSLKLKAPAALTVAPVAVAKKPTVTTKKSATAKSFADYAKLTVAKTSTVSLKVSAASKKYCAVVTTKVKGIKTMKLKGLKKGTCKVTVTVTPKKGLAKRANVTLKIS